MQVRFALKLSREIQTRGISSATKRTDVHQKFKKEIKISLNYVFVFPEK